MSPDTITPRIELLQEQIENLEKSGHFTEREIDSKTAPLRMELASLKTLQSTREMTLAMQNYGMTLESYSEGLKAFNEAFAKLKDLPQSLLDIEVVDAEILTPNHIKA